MWSSRGGGWCVCTQVAPHSPKARLVQRLWCLGSPLQPTAAAGAGAQAPEPGGGRPRGPPAHQLSRGRGSKHPPPPPHPSRLAPVQKGALWWLPAAMKGSLLTMAFPSSSRPPPPGHKTRLCCCVSSLLARPRQVESFLKTWKGNYSHQINSFIYILYIYIYTYVYAFLQEELSSLDGHALCELLQSSFVFFRGCCFVSWRKMQSCRHGASFSLSFFALHVCYLACSGFY